MHRCTLLLALAAFTSPLAAQVNTQRAAPTGAFDDVAQAVRTRLSGDRALSTVAFVEQFYRLPGNRGFNASIDTVARLLEQAGFVPESRARPDDRLIYRVEEFPMALPAWSPLDASVHIVGETDPVLTWATNHNMLPSNSHSTPPGGIEAELVDVGAGTADDFGRVDVRGKVVMGDANLGQLVTRAYAAGALGAMAPQRLPAYNQQAKNTTAIQFSGITRDTDQKTWGVFLHTQARDRLRATLARGPVRVRVRIETVFEQSPERAIVAEIRGASRPEERMVYSAHVQEPGANDNASGVGLLAEMARVAAGLVREGTLTPQRTMTFLWGNEIQWTRRYLAQDSVRRAGVKWGMSLDMVGENTALTGGTFLIEKMKDPSAVWVRGEDQHSEWGGSRVSASDIVAHWFNDFSRQRCLAQAGQSDWVVKSNPYEGGSDHTPFINAGIPAVLFWHFTDQFYHTDRDRIEMVSPTTLANVGNCALTTGLVLTIGSADHVRGALAELRDVAEHELRTQGRLSREAMAAPNAVVADQRTILETWRDYYVGALARIVDIAATPVNLTAEIAAAQDRVRATAAEELARLR